MVENPDVVDAALAGDRTAIFISGHLGPIELPGLYLAQHSGRRITAPMETLGDPALQRWFERTRATFGVRIVGLREARRELLRELRSGESVGLVADRDITGGGMEVPFFGAPAPLPVGPGLPRPRNRRARSTSRRSGVSGRAATRAASTRSR